MPRWSHSGSLVEWEAAHMGCHSRLSIGELLCSLGGRGTVLHTEDGGIEENCQVCFAHVRLPFSSRLRWSFGPANEYSCLLPYGSWKENSPTDRRRAETAFLFQRLSVLVQRFNCVLFHIHDYHVDVDCPD